MSFTVFSGCRSSSGSAGFHVWDITDGFPSRRHVVVEASISPSSHAFCSAPIAVRSGPNIASPGTGSSRRVRVSSR